MHKIDELVDQFVEVLNRKPFVSLLPDQVAQQLRIEQLSSKGEPQWQIQRASHKWVTDLEQTLAVPLPKGYRSLIERYQFDEFEIGPITFLSNIGELTAQLLTSEGLAQHLLRNGMIQFARPAGGSYDPICFAMTRRSKTDAPIVQVDHEDILIRDGRITVNKEIAPSFCRFIECVISGEFRR